jgi:hypothetical protein
MPQDGEGSQASRLVAEAGCRGFCQQIPRMPQALPLEILRRPPATVALRLRASGSLWMTNCVVAFFFTTSSESGLAGKAADCEHMPEFEVVAFIKMRLQA